MTCDKSVPLAGGQRARRGLVRAGCLILPIGPSVQAGRRTADSLPRDDVQKAAGAATGGDVVGLPA
jgi:hypothetical protein